MRVLLAVLVFGVLVSAPAVSYAQAGPPVGPVAPQIETPTALREALGGVTQSPTDIAWGRMSAPQRQQSVNELKSILDRLREQAGLPVGPVAPQPVVPAPAVPGPLPPLTPPGPPAPGSKDEFDLILRAIDDALGTLSKSTPTAAVSEAAKLRQALTKLKGFAP